MAFVAVTLGARWKPVEECGKEWKCHSSTPSLLVSDAGAAALIGYDGDLVDEVEVAPGFAL